MGDVPRRKQLDEAVSELARRQRYLSAGITDGSEGVGGGIDFIAQVSLRSLYLTGVNALDPASIALDDGIYHWPWDTETQDAGLLDDDGVILIPADGWYLFVGWAMAEARFPAGGTFDYVHAGLYLDGIEWPDMLPFARAQVPDGDSVDANEGAIMALAGGAQLTAGDRLFMCANSGKGDFNYPSTDEVDNGFALHAATLTIVRLDGSGTNGSEGGGEGGSAAALTVGNGSEDVADVDSLIFPGALLVDGEDGSVQVSTGPMLTDEAEETTIENLIGLRVTGSGGIAVEITESEFQEGAATVDIDASGVTGGGGISGIEVNNADDVTASDVDTLSFPDATVVDNEDGSVTVSGLQGGQGETGATGPEGPAGPASVLMPCRAATTANITISSALNNGDPLDGVTLATGDRVLVKDQAVASQNGIYVVGSSPARADDDLAGGLQVYVEEGTRNADRVFAITTNGAITPGTTAHTWETHPKDFGLVSTLPTSNALAGDKCQYLAATNHRWDLVYDGVSSWPWKFVGGPPLVAAVDTQQTRNNASYGDLATVGPSVTVPLDGDYGIQVGCQVLSIGAFDGLMSYSIDGSTPDDSDGLRLGMGAGGAVSAVSPERRQANLDSGDGVVAKYRTNQQTSFSNRWLRVTPVRVG